MSSSSSSSDSADLSTFLNSTEIFTIEKINVEIIPALIDQISKAQEAIPLPKSQNNNNNNEITNITVVTTTTTTTTTTTATIGEISEITTTDDKVVDNGISTTVAPTTDAAATSTLDNNGINGIQQGTSNNNTTSHSRVGFFGISWLKSATTTTTTTTKKKKKKKKKSSKDSVGKSLSLHHQHLHLHGQLEKLRIDLNNVQASFEEISKFEQTINNPFKRVLHGVDAIVKEVTKTPQASLGTNGAVQTKIRDLNKIVTTLKLHVPSAHKISSVNSETHRLKRSQSDPTSNEGSAHNLFDVLPNLSMNQHFRRSSEFSDIKEVYSRLDVKKKLCLLCFSAFPEGAVVKRRILLYWWIGEGLIVPPKTAGKTVEDLADDIIKELVMKRFIEPVNKKQRLVADCFKMHSFTHSVVITLAKEAEFFDFDAKGNPTTNFHSSHRACLIKEGSSFGLSNTSSDQSTQEHLYTLFNVSEQYLKLVPDWFLKMKNANVLQLGRWQSSAKHHIEVEDTDFLKRLKNMKFLKFLSLQGISRIMELPDTIGKLTNLRILDLRACHNLEVLPEDIGLLKNLTHLDMSECYLLDTMPKGIALLSKLQVLKGFVIGDPKSGSPCTLDDLVSLNNLRKLSISTGWEAFPSDKELTALKKLKALRKLKIAWGGRSLAAAAARNNTLKDNRPATQAPTKSSTPTKARISKTLSKLQSRRYKQTVGETLELPKDLEKLDLQCFPHTKRPSWLKPSQLTKLKKLYIRGGTLGDLCHINEVWTVEILRVKYLYELKMDWKELQTAFPDLKYLEKVKCPKLTFCPCNEGGVWLK